jgi:hypothetical protein
MTARREGGVFIGFRSPLRDGKAIVVSIENPFEIGARVREQAPECSAIDLVSLALDAADRTDLGAEVSILIGAQLGRADATTSVARASVSINASIGSVGRSTPNNAQLSAAA